MTMTLKIKVFAEVLTPGSGLVAMLNTRLLYGKGALQTVSNSTTGDAQHGEERF